LHILIMINIYMILGWSINLLVGFAGLLTLAHAAFYGIGAYTVTLLMMKFHLNFFLALIIAIIFCGIASYIVAYPSLRLKGDYFVLATLGFQFIIFTILYNWISLTRGPYGIPGIPRPTIFGKEIYSLPSFFVFTAIISALTYLFIRVIYNSQFGLALKSLREDEIAASVLGKNVFKLKIYAFIIACGLTAISGGLFATYMSYIDPTSFTLDESIFILSIVLIGGAGNLRGPLIGAVFMVILPEILRFIGLPNTIAPNVRQMIYGVLLIILMRYRPSGIAGEYKFE